MKKCWPVANARKNLRGPQRLAVLCCAHPGKDLDKEEEEEEEGEEEESQVAMATIKSSDQTLRDQVPFCRRLCYPEATTSQKIASSSIPATPLAVQLLAGVETIFQIERTPKGLSSGGVWKMEFCQISLIPRQFSFCRFQACPHLFKIRSA